MALSDSPLNIVWLKRDFRLRDHHPLYLASQQQTSPSLASQTNVPVLLLYLVEPMMLDDPHMDIRHWRFIWQSLADLNHQLSDFNTQVLVLHGNVIDIFRTFLESGMTFTLHSHEEVGLSHTYQRDKEVAQFCRDNDINWIESPFGAVTRALPDRESWEKHWQRIMRAPTFDVEFNEVKWFPSGQFPRFEQFEFEVPAEWHEKVSTMQPGGERRAWHVLHHFFQDRGRNYHWAISKPEASRKACSRLSPYLAWGNISLKQVYQTLLQHWDTAGWRRALAALSSRLHWHCHFIQKFESECDMEFRPVNRGYLGFPYVDQVTADNLVEKWRTGATGIPLVDACMRCVNETGYINFRMRAMLVSFLCHHLNVDWRLGVVHLAKMFLDFEPGIHYPQFQMQAGVTGVNLIRIYNPVKQAQDHDPQAAFIKKWVLELKDLPAEFAIQPWLLSPLESQMYDIQLGVDYPEPIVNLSESGRLARERLWSYRKKDEVKQEAQRILSAHTVPQTRDKYRRG